MSLLTAHKILIGSAVALFVLYALFEARRWLGGDPAALFRSVVSAAGATGLGLYLRTVFQKNRI